MKEKMSRAWGSPSRYVQGPGEFERLAKHTKKYGTRAGLVIDEFFFEEFHSKLTALYAEEGASCVCVKYEEEITRKRIAETTTLLSDVGVDFVVGIGGGKACDTAKCVAEKLGVAVIIVPTTASTDAPTSAMSILYDDRHEHDGFLCFIKNPELVLVDSEIITNAPVRFLVSGMGDAIATVFEARRSMLTNSENYICGEVGRFRHTTTAAIIAEASYRTILEFGLRAKQANERHVVNEALESVIEANTLMSGIGFENVGCAASHCICNGLTRAEGGALKLHGEKVAFGVICEMIAENAPSEDLEELLTFYESVGLPMTLEELGIEDSEENLHLIAEKPEETEWTREGFFVDEKAVIDIVRSADAMGRAFLESHHF